MAGVRVGFLDEVTGTPVPEKIKGSGNVKGSELEIGFRSVQREGTDRGSLLLPPRNYCG